MLPVSDELKQKLQETNRKLRQAYPAEAFDTRQIRDSLHQVGKFRKIEKWPSKKLKEWLRGGTLVGVDGSVNSTPGSYPHTLSFFQALAKGTSGEEYWAAELYTPLLEPDEDGVDGRLAREANRRGTILSGLEMDVALEAIQKWSPRVVMMDGSLLHFRIDDADRWSYLVEEALKRDILLVGVSEEIGTSSLARLLFPHHPAWSDRDLFYGVLEVGEVYEAKEELDTNGQLWKSVLRSSVSPQPIGVDGLVEQEKYRGELIRLVYTLTPRQGRGIPFWLDIIDTQVRVTDPLVKAMVEKYIDPDLQHRLLLPKRSERGN